MGARTELSHPPATPRKDPDDTAALLPEINSSKKSIDGKTRRRRKEGGGRGRREGKEGREGGRREEGGEGLVTCNDSVIHDDQHRH